MFLESEQAAREVVMNAIVDCAEAGSFAGPIGPQVFTDGSAFATRYGCLAMAGGAAALALPHSPDPVLVAEVSLPSGGEQTSQAGEFAGAYLGNILAGFVSDLAAQASEMCGTEAHDTRVTFYSDCKGVLRMCHDVDAYAFSGSASSSKIASSSLPSSERPRPERRNP